MMRMELLSVLYKISHGKKTKQEVVARSVHRTEQEFKGRGLIWPPKKK
jgi:hypothetical protein